MNGGQEHGDIRSHPRFTVVEGTKEADPAALDAVLELVVTWAIRAQEARGSATRDVVTGYISTSCGADN